MSLLLLSSPLLCPLSFFSLVCVPSLPLPFCLEPFDVLNHEVAHSSLVISAETLRLSRDRRGTLLSSPLRPGVCVCVRVCVRECVCVRSVLCWHREKRKKEAKKEGKKQNEINESQFDLHHQFKTSLPETQMAAIASLIDHLSLKQAKADRKKENNTMNEKEKHAEKKKEEEEEVAEIRKREKNLSYCLCVCV